MTNNIAIRVQNLTKTYHLYDKPQDRLKEALNPFKKSYHHDFYAMNDVSFEIKKGETIGIIGKNGAGKSTLLKMITGVLTPTSGSIEVNGKIASLLELGAGFNPEMSGLENIYLNGTLMGFSKEEMDNKVDAILEFADIGEFIYQLVKTYSSGMFARLAFASAINIDPEILIVDEVLSVGDMSFQNKCIRKMEEISKKGTTILFVTHDTGSINKFCSKAIWLKDAKIHASGKPKEVLNDYISYMSYGEKENVEKIDEKSLEQIQPSTDITFIETGSLDSFGEKNALIERIAFLDESGQSISALLQGSYVTFICDFSTKIDLFDIAIGVIFKDHLNNAILTFNSYMYDAPLDNVDADSQTRTTIRFKVPKIFPSEYSITVSLSEGTQLNHIQQHWIYVATNITVVSCDHIDACALSLYPDEIKYNYETM